MMSIAAASAASDERSGSRRAATRAAPPAKISTVVLSSASATPPATSASGAKRRSPRTTHRTASATARNATAKPTGCASAYVARYQMVCANAKSQPPRIANAALTSRSNARPQTVAAAAAIATAESALSRAATEANGIACVHSHPAMTYSGYPVG